MSIFALGQTDLLHPFVCDLESMKRQAWKVKKERLFFFAKTGLTFILLYASIFSTLW